MTGTYITCGQFGKIYTIPMALPQTQLNAGQAIQIAIVPLLLGQRFELRSCTLHLLKVLTPGVLPVMNNTALGLVSVGVYQTAMMTGSAALVQTNVPGAVTYNPNAPARFATPGYYTVQVSNNTENIDLSVIVTGSLRLFG